MYEIETILERELDNRSLIYVYRDATDGRWYAYEHSAFYLEQMNGAKAVRYVMEKALWLARTEVDVDSLPPDGLICRSKNECVLRYNPHNGFEQWLSALE